MLILLLLVLVLATVALLRTLPSDGYGTRPGPRSHADAYPLPHRLP